MRSDSDLQGPCFKYIRIRNETTMAFGFVTLAYEWDSIQKVATGKRTVTPALALRVSRFAGIAMDELLAGQWLSSRVCPHCGHPPDDFVDEETMVE
jgi:hypothetical protein